MYTVSAAIQKSQPPHDLVLLEGHQIEITPVELIVLLGFVRTGEVGMSNEGLLTVTQAKDIRRALRNGGGLEKMGSERKESVANSLDRIITKAEQCYSAVGWRPYDESTS